MAAVCSLASGVVVVDDELELELTQAHVEQKPMLRVEVGAPWWLLAVFLWPYVGSLWAAYSLVGSPPKGSGYGYQIG